MVIENTGCIKLLLKSADHVLKQEHLVRKESCERRIELWNEIRLNYDKFLEGQCGEVYQDMDRHVNSLFKGALLILTLLFREKNEQFEPAGQFSDVEIAACKKIEQYYALRVLSPADIRKKLEHRDATLLSLLSEYYYEMDKWINAMDEDPALDPLLRHFFRFRWNEYRHNIDSAIKQDPDRWMHLISNYREEHLDDARIKLANARNEAEKTSQEINKRTEEIEAKEYEVRKKELEICEKSKEVERIKMQWDKVKDSSSRFIRFGDVKQYEMNFIGRNECKFGARGDLIRIFGKSFVIDEISEEKGCPADRLTPGITHQLTDTEIRNLPENRYLTIKLVEKKFWRRKERYTFRALFLSRPRNYAEFGFDTEPITINDLNPILADTRDEAKKTEQLFFLCIASPTGFDPGLHGFIDNEDFHKNLLSRYLSVCFLDLETGTIIANPSDEVAKAFLPYCELVMDSEKMEKAQRFLSREIEEQFKIKDYAEFTRSLKSCQEAGLSDESIVKSAFYRFSDANGRKVRYIEGVGLVMMR
jgi:hypothetical protein